MRQEEERLLQQSGKEDMAKFVLGYVLKVLMIFVVAGWISLWLLKPTNMWTSKWKAAEDRAGPTVFGYYSLYFAVYTFPVIAVAIIGRVYLNLQSKEPTRSRRASKSSTGLSNPVIVNSLVGILSSLEIIAVSLFLAFLAWTFYARISNDFNKLMPDKSLDLNLWQLKYLRVAIRFGLLAEACLALMLLPVLRSLALFQILGIQFEASLRYHIWLGTSMIFFSFVHGASTLFIWGVSHNIQHEVWRWQKTGRIYLAGEIALVTGLVIWITSLPQIRRRRFEFFYYTHHLYIIFLLFFLFHVGDRHFYMVFPGIFLFVLDKLLRIVQSNPGSCILSARIFPGKSVELVLPKDPSLKYTPTSAIYMKIPSISKFQWHPFSLTSSSNNESNTMSVMIKCENRWTCSLYDKVQEEMNSDAENMSCIPVAVEGPYGPASLDFLRYDSLVMIAGGIGITPFLSILKEINSAQSSSRYRLPKSIQLIYVVKKSQDICQLKSVSPMLLSPSSKNLDLKLKVFVTQEDRSSITVRELLNDFSLVQTINLSTKCANYAVHGLESSQWTAALVALTSIVFLVFMICFNHIFVPSGKNSSLSKKVAMKAAGNKAPKEKTPSSVTDAILLLSFITAVLSGTFVAVILRWKRLKKGIPSFEEKQGKTTEVLSGETRSDSEEHEIHFGGRPDFQDLFYKFQTETAGTDVGVLVCGPENMKKSVASQCQVQCQGFNVGAKPRKAYFSFHSLNFTM